MQAVLAVTLLALASAFAIAPLHLVAPDRLVQDSYIVVLHDNVTADVKSSHLGKLGATEGFALQWDWTIINGYAATITSRSLLSSILADPMVSYVEQDQVMSINYQKETPTDYENNGQSANIQVAAPFDSVLVQTGLPAGLWGLGRIWQVVRQPTATTYQYWATAGAGVDAYIVDTGLNAAHVEFTGRITAGATFVTDANWPGTSDGNGHGSHVGSTTAGTTYGVAKKAQIIPVKVLTAAGSGTNAGVISGVDYVRTTYGTRRRPSVANMSLGGGASAALDTAVNNAATAGVTMVVAAGNDNANACNYSPARATGAITVMSITNTDARSSFSNIGTCCDLFAPGSNILGAWFGSATATSTISGTSMASPHVCGGAALYLGHLESDASPTVVRNTLNSRATANAVTSPGTGSPNRLLFTSTTQ